MKIAVLGYSGSGKSTTTKYLGKLFHIFVPIPKRAAGAGRLYYIYAFFPMGLPVESVKTLPAKPQQNP